MSLHREDRIYKPPFFKLQHLTRGRGNRSQHVIGFDSEAHSCGLLKHKRCAENGYPFLYQFGYPDGTCDLVNVPRTGRKYETLFAFLGHLHSICTRKDTEYVVFGYNLSYEYTQLFRDLGDTLKEAGEFRLGDKENGIPSFIPLPGQRIPFYLEAMNEKRYAFTIEWAATKRRVRVIDAMAFLGGGLDNAAKMIGAGRKERKPPTFDRGSAQDAAFVRYATQDAILTQKLGEWIVDLHRQYDVSQCISAPHFASKVYKRGFLQGNIPLPDAELEQDGLAAYHGGKNGYYRDRPLLLQRVWHVDIRSAYPEAMRQLPDPERSEWTFSDRYKPDVHAIWRVKGKYRKCRYRSLMANGSWPNSGHFSGTVTSYELDGALASGEIELTSCQGWMMQGPSGGSLTDFVDTFYQMKRYAKTQTERIAAKLFLNSLYGKFFQKVAQGSVGATDMDTLETIYTDPSQRYDYVAGGLYHPPIAALITGFVRAKIHRLEHAYESIMTSTDGFFSLKAPPADALGKELGMLSAEQGTLRIHRERVYVFDPDIPEHQDDCKPTCRDPHPVFALHGFMGTLDGLRRVPLTPGNVYHYLAKPHPVLLRMSTKRIGGERYQPGEFVEDARKLTMPGPSPPKLVLDK